MIWGWLLKRLFSGGLGSEILEALLYGLALGLAVTLGGHLL